MNNSTTSENGITQQPTALVAQTIIHEVIHAEFFRQIIVAIGQGQYIADYDVVKEALKNSNYPRLSEYFRTKSDWAHNYMAYHYRKAIARVTQEFATGVPVTEPNEQFMAFAWRGLDIWDTEHEWTGVQAWMELVGDINNPSPAAVSIEQIIINYTAQNFGQPCQN